MSQLPAVQSPIPWNKWGILSSVLTPSPPPSWHPVVRPFPGCHDTQGRVLSRSWEAQRPCGRSLLLASVTLGKPYCLDFLILKWVSWPLPQLAQAGGTGSGRADTVKLLLCSKPQGPMPPPVLLHGKPLISPSVLSHVLKPRASSGGVKPQPRANVKVTVVHSTVFLRIIRMFWRPCYTYTHEWTVTKLWMTHWTKL